MKRTKFPKGWDEERVTQVLRHYDQQAAAEAVAEDEAAFEDPKQTVIEVPRELVPAIRELIAKHENRTASRVLRINATGRNSRSRRAAGDRRR